jgi:hypothetical protein
MILAYSFDNPNGIKIYIPSIRLRTLKIRDREKNINEIEASSIKSPNIKLVRIPDNNITKIEIVLDPKSIQNAIFLTSEYPFALLSEKTLFIFGNTICEIGLIALKIETLILSSPANMPVAYVPAKVLIIIGVKDV